MTTTPPDTRFTTRLDPRAFQPHAAQEEALARLHYAVEHRLRLVLVFGPAGCGKTLLLQAFAARLRNQGHATAEASLVGGDPREAAWSLLTQWGRRPDAAADMFTLWRGIVDQITEFRYEARPTILLLDDLDAANPEMMLFLQRLMSADPAADSSLTIVGTLDWLSRSRLPRRLLDAAELRIDLEPWKPDETAAFLHQGPAEESPVFTDDAAMRLHTLSDGLPRRINQLARLVVIAAEGRELTEVDAEMVEDVQRELGVRR